MQSIVFDLDYENNFQEIRTKIKTHELVFISLLLLTLKICALSEVYK